MALFAQCGFGKGDKLSRAFEGGLLEGVVFTPKGETPDSLRASITGVSQLEKKPTVLIDPQFYFMAMPETLNMGRLSQYPHFRDGVTNRLLSSPEGVQEVVASSLDMQRNFKVDALISPSIFFDSFDSRNSQVAINIAYESIKQIEDQETAYLSLCVEEAALSNLSAMNEYLDILCNLDVRGFYIVVDRARGNGNTGNMPYEHLSNLMQVCYVLSELNGYEVIIGYADYLGVPLVAAGADAIATGWYSNLRRFHMADHEVRQGGRRPRKRLSSGVLMNSILLSPELMSIPKKDWKLLHGDSPYGTILDSLPSQENWTDTLSCLQNWYAIRTVLAGLEPIADIKERMQALKSIIANSKNAYSQYEIDVWEERSRNNHLIQWSEAIDLFCEHNGFADAVS